MTFCVPSVLPLEEALLARADAAWRGTVEVSAPRVRRRLFVDGGLLVGVASDNPVEWLGHFLVGSALIGEEQLRAALVDQEAEAAPLGVVLQRLGAVDQARLEEALAAQAREVVCAAFEARPVEVHLHDDLLPADHPLGLRLAVPPLVLDGIRRRIRCREIESCLGGFDVVPARTSALEPPALAPWERQVLAAVDGERGIEAIALACHLAPFRVAEFVLRGVEAGFLSVRPAAETLAEMADEEALARAEAQIEAGALKEAWDVLRPLTARPTSRETFARVEELVERIRRTVTLKGLFQPLVPRVAAGADAVARHSLEPTMAYVLSRINGAWTLRQIEKTVPLEPLHFAVIIDALLQRGLLTLEEAAARS